MIEAVIGFVLVVQITNGYFTKILTEWGLIF